MAGNFSLKDNLTVPGIFQQKNIQSLDGLRAIAIALVLVWHIQFALNCPPYIYNLCKYFEFGNSGVQLFFVISGFLITGLLLKEQAEAGIIQVKSFFMKRFLKIIPSYVIYLLTIVILSFFTITTLDKKNFLTAFLFISDFTGSKNWLVGHYWTLAVEIQFYFCLPVMVIFLPRKYFLVAAIVLLYDLFYFVLRLYPILFIFRGLFLSLPPLIFGSMLSLGLYKNWFKRIYTILMHPVFAFSLILSLVIFFPRFYKPLRFLKIPYDYMISCLLMTSFLYYAIHCNKGNIVYLLLNNRIIVTIGALSYSIYVWQQLFFAPASAFNVYPTWAVFPLNIVLMTATALLSYNFVEKPFLRLKAKLK